MKSAIIIWTILSLFKIASVSPLWQFSADSPRLIHYPMGFDVTAKITKSTGDGQKAISKYSSCIATFLQNKIRITSNAVCDEKVNEFPVKSKVLVEMIFGNRIPPFSHKIIRMDNAGIKRRKTSELQVWEDY